VAIITNVKINWKEREISWLINDGFLKRSVFSLILVHEKVKQRGELIIKF